MKKKAQLGNLQGIILVLVIVGILLAAGFFIFDAFQDQIDDIDNSVAAENSSATVGIAYLNSTGYTVNQAGANCFNNFVVVDIANRTNGSTISSAVYSVDADTGLVNGTTATNWNNVTLQYTYQSGSTACLGIKTTSDAMLTIPELLGLIVLIAVIGVILATIFNVIPGARTSGA